jgi:RNA polymerase sigma factor (sigma-70 family)
LSDVCSGRTAAFDEGQDCFVTSLATHYTKLIERARDGDPRALDQLLVVCRPDLERYARRHCESDDVEEAVQDALWIVSRKLGALRSVAAFAGWLFQVVRRACRALARGRWRHLSLETVQGDVVPDSSAPNPELRVMVVAAIASLPRAYREVLLLRDLQGLTAQEVASSLEVSEEAAKSRLHRARVLVRNALSDTGAPLGRKVAG